MTTEELNELFINYSIEDIQRAYSDWKSMHTYYKIGKAATNLNIDGVYIMVVKGNTVEYFNADEKEI